MYSFLAYHFCSFFSQYLFFFVLRELYLFSLGNCPLLFFIRFFLTPLLKTKLQTGSEVELLQLLNTENEMSLIGLAAFRNQQDVITIHLFLHVPFCKVTDKS